MSKCDWLSIIVIGAMVSSITVAVITFYKMEHMECTSSPLTYAAQMYEEAYGYEAFGSLQLIHKNSPVFYFNKQNITMEQTGMNNQLIGIDIDEAMGG